jgi:hypothetical protein
MNMVRRGGIYQCRPGYRERLRLPDGRLQGWTWFRPTGGDVQFLFAVDGNIYMTLPPFDSYVQLTGISLSDRAERVYFQRCEQSVVRNEDNSLTLINPVSTLIIQDGKSPPAYWNGSSAENITGDETTPLGTHMAWSGGRLWVANGERLYAGDIYNPFSFREGQYIGPSGINSFVLPGEITGLEEVPSVATPMLLAFTTENTTAFQSNIRNRDEWESTPNFQKVVFPDTGCVAPLSIVSTHGFLWWFSAQGLVNVNVAAQSQISSERSVIDGNMAYSKKRLGPDLDGVCCGAFGGYLMVSVPYASRANKHTWVTDLQGLDTSISLEGPTWDSYWTGTQPVQWLSATIAGVDRCFHISVDRDGNNRMWEAFMPERLDNFSPITWAMETRGYLFGSKQLKRWKYAKITMSEFWGETHVKVSWAGTMRGRYKECATKIVNAQKGTIFAPTDVYSVADSTVFSFKKQSRTVETVDTRQAEADDYDSCATESANIDDVDYGFQLCIMGTGPGGIRSIRAFANPENMQLSGACEKNETNFRATKFDGSASAQDTLEEAVEDLLAAPLSIFTACATVAETVKGYNVVGTACETSAISQAAANYKAQEVAKARAAEDLRVNGPKFFGGFESGICFATTEPFDA